MTKIGITEGSDASLDNRWWKWVESKKPAILITKNPILLFEQIKQFDNPNIIVHCTITGNGSSVLEPNVPHYDETLKALYNFTELLGPNRTVLRIDPIIPVMPYIKNSYIVLENAKSYLKENMCRVRISIYDDYKHSHIKLKQAGIDLKYENFHYPLKARKNIWYNMGKPELCGEPGLPSTPCISKVDCDIFGVEPGQSLKFQRTNCDCLSNKQELTPSKHPCKHNCLYCFWKEKNNE